MLRQHSLLAGWGRCTLDHNNREGGTANWQRIQWLKEATVILNPCVGLVELNQRRINTCTLVNHM